MIGSVCSESYLIGPNLPKEPESNVNLGKPSMTVSLAGTGPWGPAASMKVSCNILMKSADKPH